MSQQQRIARNTLLAIIGVAAAGIVRFVFTIATGRAFGTGTLGEIAVIIAVATIVTIPAAGIGAAANRFLAVASGAGDEPMRHNILGASWRGAVLAIVAAVGISWMYLTAQSAANIDTTSLVLGLAFVASYGLYLTSKGVLFGDGKANRYALGEVIGVVAFAVSLAVVLASSMSPGWVLASQVLWALGVVGVAIVASVGPTTFKGTAPVGLWPFAATATVGSLVSLGVTQATVLIMASIHGPDQAGLLAAAVAITAPLYLLPRGLSLALTPAMSYNVGAGSQDRANLDTTYTTTVLVLFGGIAAASIIALSPVVLAAYGNDFVDADAFVAIFAIASFIAITGIPIVNRFASAGTKPLRLTVIASAIGALGAAAIWFTLGESDPTWMAVGFLVASAVKVAIPFAMSNQVTGRIIVPGIGVMLVSSVGIAAAFLPTPWQFISLGLLILVALPVLFVATVRYRAQAAALSASGRPLTIGVLTNVYPLPEYPHYGVFVHDRVEAYEALGCDVVVTAPRRKSGAVKYLQLTLDAFAGLLRRPIPDVYEVHPTQPTGVLAVAVTWAAQRPYVLYAHGGDLSIGPKSRLYGRLVRRAIHGAAEIHTNSAHMSNNVLATWPDAPRIDVIPPGVRMPESTDQKPAKDIDILFVGNMIHRKGVDILIDAVGAIPDRGGLNIVAAGDGPELEEYRDQASSSGITISFPGSIPPSSVGPLMARAKVVAVPSRYEPLGQVAVEALAQGTPVVVTDTGGLASIPTPSCGSVVPPDDSQMLADALTRWMTVTESEAAETAVAARDRAAAFSLEIVAAEAIERFTITADTARRSGQGSVISQADG